MCSDNESPMPSHRKCKNITKVFPYNLENMIYIVSKRRKLDSIKKQYPNAIICDVTSTSPNSLVILSPFYPHMNIPIPFSPNYTGASVEGIWQGLKVFVGEDIDINSFTNTSMKNIKRTCKTRGKVLGHRKGIHGIEILDYKSAKLYIYIPSYKWVLDNVVNDLISKMREAHKTKDLVLLDYNTCQDVLDDSKPLSHAYLIKAYILGLYPYNTENQQLSFFDDETF